MLRFRPRLTPPPSTASPPDLLAVGQTIDELMQPGHFFVAGGLRLHWTAARAENVPWEIFRGCLVPATQTRQQARFLSWHITEDGADTPLLSVRLDVNAGVVHVTRGILCYVWEGYDAGGGVIESREVQRWTRELVGSAELHRFADLDDLRDELTCLIWQAIVGTSKLPLHSVEAPLPAFSLGQLHYCYRPWAERVDVPIKSWETLFEAIERPELSRRERARILEFMLRFTDDEGIVEVAKRFRTRGQEAVALLRAIFNDVSLSPYTWFVEQAFDFHSDVTAKMPPEESADFFGGLLRQLCRHLTAYDLITFHHRGANYPDALLLEAALGRIQWVLDSPGGIFLGKKNTFRLRRRALRQACLLRRFYQEHAVPDVPTSPGENNRVLPSPHVRVPDDQLVNIQRRPRHLYAENPIKNQHFLVGHPVLAESIHDLRYVAERTELGIGLFIDRPLGYGKAAGEPDLTPMLAHEAFSPSIARQRMRELMQLAEELTLDLPHDFAVSTMQLLDGDTIAGLPAVRLAEPARPTAALADVRRVADDFVIVRTLPGGLGELLGLFDFAGVQARIDLPMLRQGQRPRVVAMVQSAHGPVLGFFDDDYECRLECRVDDSEGFFRRAGVELPIAGLRVVGAEVHIPFKS